MAEPIDPDADARNAAALYPAGFVSFGRPEGDVPSMKRGVPAIVARISRDLFLADLDMHRRRLGADVAPDFAEALYARAVSCEKAAGTIE